MSLIEETLNRAVRDIINGIIDIPEFAIKAKQNAPRPIIPYASVNVVNISSVGWEEHKLTDRVEDDDIDSEKQGYREVMISLNFYNDGSMDNASLVKIGLTRLSVVEILNAANLGLGRRSEVRDISEILENGWEERSQFDFVLSAVGADEEIIRSIMTINISGEFETGNSSIPINVEV